MLEEIIVFALQFEFYGENRTFWDMGMGPLVDKTGGLVWPVMLLVLAAAIRMRTQSSGPALLFLLFASAGLNLFLPQGLAGHSQVFLFFLTLFAFVGITVRAVAERL